VRKTHLCAFVAGALHSFVGDLRPHDLGGDVRADEAHSVVGIVRVGFVRAPLPPVAGVHEGPRGLLGAEGQALVCVDARLSAEHWPMRRHLN
jgi:hypothetical protein